MDPNETLRRMRELHTQWNEESAIDSVDLAAAMFDYFDALDTWLSRGGFLPDAWRQTLPKTINGMSADDWSDVRDERDYGKPAE
jgi:hypothetical protein